MNFNCLCLLDTLRYIKNIENLSEINAEIIIIKEISNNYLIRCKRKKQFDHKLYSPEEIVKIFKNYIPSIIYCSKFVIRINKPKRLMLKVLNLLSPTYVLVLKLKNNFQKISYLNRKK